MSAQGVPPRRPAKRNTTTAVRSSKPRDPAIENTLQLSTFENNYSTEEFIGALSEKLIAESKANPGLAERTKKMETDVRRAEREYGKRLRELDGGFEAIGKSFTNLESKVTDVGRTAVRIAITGENTSPLEQLFATRTSRQGREKLAVVLRRLMAIAKDVADNAATALSEAEAGAVPKEVTNGDGESQEPVVSQKVISKRRMEREKAERVRDEIEGYCERFEKELLKLFDRSYKKGDPRMMAHCAKTLQEFNGGASCIQIYVNQHDFFIKDHSQIEKDEQDGVRIDIWATIGNPDEPPPTTEPGLEALCNSIRSTISQESQIMKAVFYPNSSAVMEGFLQRIFAQVIQQHLEGLVQRASSISTLAILRVLHLTHSICSSLVEDLKTYDSTLTTPPASSSRVPAPAGSGGSLSAFLDRALEEMYVPWLEGTRYLECESKNLVELYAGLLSRFTRYHETVLQAKPNSLLNKVVHQLATSGSSATTSSTAQTAAAAISKYANLFTSSSNPKTGTATPTLPPSFQKPGLTGQLRGANGGDTTARGTGSSTPVIRSAAGQELKGDLVNKGLEDKVWSTDGTLAPAMAERMMKWHAEAVGRAVELSNNGDVGKNALALLKVLSEAIGRSFIETALDSAFARLEQQDSKTEPDLQLLAILKAADQICHLWQRYTAMALFPLGGSNVPIRREMITLNSHSVVRMEGKVNNVIQKAIDNVISWLSYLLTKQKKNDYKPKNDDLSFARTITEPCELCCEFLTTVKDAANEGLSGKNAEAFLTEVGVSFHTLLLDHYKKFPVNPTGGLMLTKDLASYQDVMASYGVPAINDRFDMLRQLGNSFIVQPNVLKSYLTESHLGRIDARLLRPYLAQRSDYSQFSRSLQLDEGLPAGAASDDTLTTFHAPGHGHGLFKSSRLSTMSGVAGAGMGKLKDMLKELDSLSPEEVSGARANAPKSPAAYQPMPMFYMH
ncbi:exocyst complex component protein [Cryptococcus bacillisporus CA1873]|uniref:Exocyst complex component protein n=1 Tax=Cryptococcus bacillisporus CA1873 TaxID=1296111 RepID=A0ABR5B238_CRYGA|nr:exocyst complex component protein [Cryptococcus bacillisporus CA1873]|eukprot:KIR57631.1 exocyst complex component protein [Cryptococcus gattii CA1873]